MTDCAGITPWQILAFVFVGWLILAASSWLVFVMVTRKKAIEASIALKKRSIDKRQRVDEAALGAMAEGRGPIPGDEEDAAIEQRAIKRMRGY